MMQMIKQFLALFVVMFFVISVFLFSGSPTVKKDTSTAVSQQTPLIQTQQSLHATGSVNVVDSAEEILQRAYGLESQGLYKQAIALYTKSAILGNSDAQYNLGVLYNNGFGVKQNQVQAVFWFNQAAERGNKEAIASLTSIRQEEAQRQEAVTAAERRRKEQEITNAYIRADLEQYRARVLARVEREYAAETDTEATGQNYESGRSVIININPRNSQNSGASTFGTEAGAINPTTGEFYAPAGGGGYVGTRDGRFYAPAGPNGVIDTRTGQFIPVN
jgi:TPR repeat protein